MRLTEQGHSLNPWQINPGEVKVLRGKGLPQIIYQTEGVQANPYGGLRLNIAPTVVNVRIDVPIDLDAPRERLVASPEHRPQNHTLARSPSGALVEGSATPPSPFHHSPQLMGANGGQLDLRFGSHPPSMTLPQNLGGAPASSPMPSMAGFSTMGVMLQQPAQRPQARPAPAFACS
jgi:protein Tob/BTG